MHIIFIFALVFEKMAIFCYLFFLQDLKEYNSKTIDARTKMRKVLESAPNKKKKSS